MKLSSREQIESLAKNKSENLLTTSFFFDTDKSNKTKKEIFLSLKNLLNQAKIQIEGLDEGKGKKDSLAKDLKNIQDFADKNFASYPFAGIAAFSCSNDRFWQVLDLPSAPRNRIIFDRNPYVRPLSALLNAHHKINILVFDRKEAQWFDLFLGEIKLLHSLKSDVPSKVKEGGWEGYESKRIERHIATHLHDFLKNISDKTFSLDKGSPFDWLLIGCPNEYFPDFQSLLHPYLKNKKKGRLKLKPGDSQEKILKESLRIIERLEKEEDEETVRRFVSELEKGGLAVSGLKSTLQNLNRGVVQTLIVTRHFIHEGRKCPRCQFLFTNEPKCPSCQIKTDKVNDIIDEAVESALEKNCRVEHINPPVRLGRYGKIGAFLRYKY
jgi:peptide subunit release factor 1 (eRF1)